jgi:hypothetical protein
MARGMCEERRGRRVEGRQAMNVVNLRIKMVSLDTFCETVTRIFEVPADCESVVEEVAKRIDEEDNKS